jgi:hypothetical protein
MFSANRFASDASTGLAHNARRKGEDEIARQGRKDHKEGFSVSSFRGLFVKIIGLPPPSRRPFALSSKPSFASLASVKNLLFSVFVSSVIFC